MKTLRLLTRRLFAGLAIAAAIGVGHAPVALADTRSISPTVRDGTAEPEEVVVTGSRLEPGSVVPYEDMQHVHDSRAKGACLYKRGRYDEAFPYLQAAAKRGFKLAQARVGFLHQKGLGTRRDPNARRGQRTVPRNSSSTRQINLATSRPWRVQCRLYG